MVGQASRAASIAEKGKGKVEFLRKRRILCDRIKTDPHDFHIPCTKLGDLVTEPATFGRSAWCVCFRVKP